VAAIAVGITAAVLIAGGGIWQFGQVAHLQPPEPSSATAAADRLIPQGSCVVTNDASFTITANRFVSNVAGCPSVVDSYGTFMVMTDGYLGRAKPSVLRSVATAWQTWFAHADYVWLETSDLKGQIPWTHALYSYFSSHFRLVGLASHDRSAGTVPPGGLYKRR